MKLSKVILTISLDSFGLLKYEMGFGLRADCWICDSRLGVTLSHDYGLLDFG
jgi:hypothetical protein